MNDQLNQNELTKSGFLGDEKLPINPLNPEPIMQSVTTLKPKRKSTKLIISIVVLIVVIILVVLGLSKLLNTTGEIDNTINSINQSLDQTKYGDFQDDLNVGYIDEGPMSTTGKEITDNLSQIDTMLTDLNNQSDFEDLGTLNFSQ